MKFALLFVLVAGSCALEYIDDFTVDGKFLNGNNCLFKHAWEL